MRRYPASWAILAVSVGLLTASATVFRTVEIDTAAAWLLLGMAMTLIAQWTAIEVYTSIESRKKGDEDEPRKKD